MPNSTWTNAPIVYVPTTPSSQAISRITAMVYSMVISLLPVRVHLTPAPRAEAIHGLTHPIMQQLLTRVCAVMHITSRRGTPWRGPSLVYRPRVYWHPLGKG